MTPNANKTFLSSFLAAFRAQNAAGIPKAPATPPTHGAATAATAASATVKGQNAAKAGAGGTPHPITTKTSRTPSPGPGVNGPAQFTATRHHATPPYVRSTSPIAAAHSHGHGHGRAHSPGYNSLSTSPAAAAAYTPNYPGSPGTGKGFQIPSLGPPPSLGSPPLSERGRRGSDSSSSSGGFQDVLGREAWYIGGRTACGEERFYRLGVVKGRRSVDRLSCDRLSV